MLSSARARHGTVRTALKKPGLLENLGELRDTLRLLLHSLEQLGGLEIHHGIRPCNCSKLLRRKVRQTPVTRENLSLHQRKQGLS